MPIDSIYDFTDKALVELKSWLEPWFLTRDVDAAGAGGTGLQYNIGTYGPHNSGDWLDVTMTGGGVAAGLSAGAQFTSPEGLAFIVKSGGSNSGAGVTITDDETGANICTPFDIEATSVNGDIVGAAIDCAVSGTGGSPIALSASGNQNNVSAIVDAKGVEGIGVTKGSGDAYGGGFNARATGSGREIALVCNTDGQQTGAKSLAILCKDHADNPIFEVRDNGSVHIKTGTSIIADL